ncbi:hypothetical protein ABIE64_002635 [Thalassospira sp. MBR-102]|uniref:helix-turn-helix domain-containing protein n=1 Tax=Thalassospira sp. MBR-102 TaxID=3156466 RepID=UPI00339B223B
MSNQFEVGMVVKALSSAGRAEGHVGVIREVNARGYFVEFNTDFDGHTGNGVGRRAAEPGIIEKPHGWYLSGHALVAVQSEEAKEAGIIGIPDIPMHLLSPQEQTIFKHIVSAGHITALDAMVNYGITSAALSRRICDMEDLGVRFERERRQHPVTKKRYTRYKFSGSYK